MKNKTTGLVIIIVILMVVSSFFLYFFSYGVSYSSGSGYSGCPKRNPDGSCIHYESLYSCETDELGKCVCTRDDDNGICRRGYDGSEEYYYCGEEKERFYGCITKEKEQTEEIVDNYKDDNSKDDNSIKEFFENMDEDTVAFLLTFVISFVVILLLILNLKKRNPNGKAHRVLLVLFIIIYTFIFLNSIVVSIRSGSSWKKPVLYLYPEEDIDVKINFKNEDILKTTYPKYNDGWEVHVKSDGSITDENGRGYYALYWDEEYNSKEDFSTGFYVKSEDSIKFLEEKLNEIGLTEREANEFIMYWLPIMEENGNNLVHFEFTKDREKTNKINIDPKPDSMLRLGIVIKKVDKKVKIKAQKLEHFDRVGFSVVEWGGTIIN